MSEASGTGGMTCGRVYRSIVIYVVARCAHPARNVVQTKRVPGSLSNIVVRTGRVAADANRAYKRTIAGVQSQSSAEHIDATNFFTNHGIRRRAIKGSVAPIGNANVHGITVLQTIQAAAWLHRGKKVAGG